MLISRKTGIQAGSYDWDSHWEQKPITESYLSASYWDGYWPIYNRYLPKNELILEAGCGLGRYLIPLTRMGFRVVGVDLTAESLKRVHDFESGTRLARADICRLPFPDGCFGAYISLGVLEHFESGMAEPLREARRVVRPGGRLLVAVPYANWIRYWRNRRSAMEPAGEFYQYMYNVREIHRQLASEGLRILYTRRCNRLGEIYRTLKPLRRRNGSVATVPAARELPRPNTAAPRNEDRRRRWVGLAETVLPPWATALMVMVVCENPA